MPLWFSLSWNLETLESLEPLVRMLAREEGWGADQIKTPKTEKVHREEVENSKNNHAERRH